MLVSGVVGSMPMVGVGSGLRDGLGSCFKIGAGCRLMFGVCNTLKDGVSCMIMVGVGRRLRSGVGRRFKDRVGATSGSEGVAGVVAVQVAVAQGTAPVALQLAHALVA